MIGRRLPDSTDGVLPELQPGDYIKVLGGPWTERLVQPLWVVRTPNGCLCYLNEGHTFTEHDDGMLTVTPSIGCFKDANGSFAYHGFLEHGVWRDA